MLYRKPGKLFLPLKNSHWNVCAGAVRSKLGLQRQRNENSKLSNKRVFFIVSRGQFLSLLKRYKHLQQGQNGRENTAFLQAEPEAGFV
ncbi:hypothetical protein CR205_07925 [Alteribacter lacisalsi]|uniref:Uncharacterized protein n=1 Tax=Alteribacter lacisalsi TaxID=2045244 RepID=A0A2W0H9I1_9BACI|nr:hypothetical protein CR205_07925 [Alteribacter lacisalsi]